MLSGVQLCPTRSVEWRTTVQLCPTRSVEWRTTVQLCATRSVEWRTTGGQLQQLVMAATSKVKSCQSINTRETTNILDNCVVSPIESCLNMTITRILQTVNIDLVSLCYCSLNAEQLFGPKHNYQRSSKKLRLLPSGWQ